MRKDKHKKFFFLHFFFVSWNKTFEQKMLRVFKRERRFWKRRHNGRRRKRLLPSGGRSLIACQWPRNHYSMKAARAEETGSMDPPSRRGVAHRFICQHIVHQIKDKIPAQQ
ncbi:hypothetical protein CDAR_443021 [Caerostris darwini]|uniref:Secreted protein n=1 Tax=Caerostris darwini TaxID=1538125 RepID=A0AAV4VPR1_9ARAC|nr:hypothetical protein CDAR_443021 [Caerostris darwini]